MQAVAGRRSALLIAGALVASGFCSPAVARNVCTVVANAATGAVLVREGDCATRVTPASTFKVPLALIGSDAGFLRGAGAPLLEIAPGEPDWGGPAWKRPVDPASWMRHSVVWYSQRIAKNVGARQLAEYAQSFGYGNADFSGDPGKDNGLERAWISSSLKISPDEQAAFLRRLVNRELPLDASAYALADAIVETTPAAGWTIAGKTGSAYPRRADGSFDRSRGWGWFVGWARRDGAALVFARLDQDERRHERSGGLRAKEAFIAAWPATIAGGAR